MIRWVLRRWLDGDVIRALYVVRNPDKLRHLQQR